METGTRGGKEHYISDLLAHFKTTWTLQPIFTLTNKDMSEINAFLMNFPDAMTYETNVKDWTCTCGQQKYDCHHLCKHLVQAVAPPPLRFWREVRQRQVVPLYRHPNLVASGENEGGYIEPDGVITDGDDGEWSGDKSVLEGGGGWEEIVA